MLRDEGTRRRAAGDGLHHGRLDFGEVEQLEETAHFTDDLAALEQDLAGVFADDHVDVALAVALLDVGEAVPLAGDGAQRLRKDAEIGELGGLFAGARGEQGPLAADKIADIEELPEGELVAEALHLGIDLELTGFILDVSEDVLAHLALGDEPSGDAHGAFVGIIIDHVKAGFGAGKGLAERVDAHLAPCVQSRPSQGQ